jgi:hypothetical protein
LSSNSALCANDALSRTPWDHNTSTPPKQEEHGVNLGYAALSKNVQQENHYVAKLQYWVGTLAPRSERWLREAGALILIDRSSSGGNKGDVYECIY